MSCQFDDKSIFGSSCGGSPIKKFRRSRDERKRLNKIGKKENTIIEDEVSCIISPVKKNQVSPHKEVITLSNHKGTNMESPRVIHRSNQNSTQKINSALSAQKVLGESNTNV